jgi:hypothetical protein|tara:strand:+ start:1072 stop:1569 length:498 start_codon:yes stop_codon:yes gene_type:complete
MIDIPQMRAHIGSILADIGTKYAHESAIDLVLTTGIVESRYRYIRQIRGPARGFWQVEPKTAHDNVVSYLKYRVPLIRKCAEVSHIPLSDWVSSDVDKWDEILETNIAAGIIHCRMKYWRVPRRLPKTTRGMASYWKKWYNTDKGAGKKEHFIEAVTKYLIDDED